MTVADPAAYFRELEAKLARYKRQYPNESWLHAELVARAEKAEEERDALKARVAELEAHHPTWTHWHNPGWAKGPAPCRIVEAREREEPLDITQERLHAQEDEREEG